MRNAIKYKGLIFIIGFMFYGIFMLNAQFFNYVNYTVNEGFPQSNANKIIQDSKGYIWFATQNGAIKFDGFNFFVFNKEYGIKSNVVVDIIQDKEGYFWVSTKKGLAKFNNDTIINYTIKDGLFSNIISRTFELDDGSIVVVTYKGTNIIKNGIVKKVSNTLKPISFFKRKNGDVLALTNSAIYKLENSEFIKDLTLLKGIPKPYTAFVEDKNGNLWVSTDEALHYITPNNTISYTKDNGLDFNEIDNLLVDNENSLWFISEENGCGFFKNNEFIILTFTSGFTNQSVLSIFQDNEKNIWIGGRSGATMINTKSPFVHYSKISLIDNEIVMGICSDKNNNIWFSTYGQGLTKFDGKKYQYLTKKNGNIDNHFFDVEVCDNGDLLFASKSHGVVKYDGKVFSSLKVKNGKHINARLFTSFKDSQGNIWFGGQGKNLYRYTNNELIDICKFYNVDLTGIMAIAEDSKHNVWFGSIQNGLYKYDGEKIVKVNGLNNASYIRAITNRNGTLWIGTASEGIFRVSKKNGKYDFVQFSKEDGLNSDNVYVLFADKKGNLWVGTEKGVDKLSFDQNGNFIKINNYTKNEGFLGIETNINGVLEDSKGNIWFGTVNGAVRYNEKLDKHNTVLNKLYLTSIDVFFKNINLLKYSDSIKDNLPVNLVLPYNKNHLTFNFVGLCYSNPSRVKYKYRLLGQNNKWSPPVSDKKAVFSNIAAGNYEFQVISANNDGVWNIEPTTFKFEVKPPFWKELWFLALLLLSLLLIIFYIINYRIKSLKKTKKELENKVKERTAEINKQKDKLEKINLKTQESINYAGKIQNAMFPVNYIFKENFSQYFILNKPKHVISGDFYWAKEMFFQNEKYVIFVVADCTGHGIPGALISILGMSLLNEIGEYKGFADAGLALEKLRTELKKALNQTGGLDDQTEGIDLTLCVLNLNTLEMQFSGANNPLYIIRQQELIVYPPTPNPIGVFIKEISFKNIKIQLQKDDTLYMFSDGYVDQFNGKTGAKFKISQFRELLIAINNQALKRQKLILDAKFSDWKADSEQIDDVLILGLKI